jgi:hypothetical protein
VRPLLVYRSSIAYELSMRLLYGRHYRGRMRAVAAEVPPGSAVVELCCGRGTLYTRYLHESASSYIGLETDARFVAGLRRHGIDARPVDLTGSREPIPSADVTIIQAGLYHFRPDPTHIIDRMLAAARRLAIVSEPVGGLASSSNPMTRLITRSAIDPRRGGGGERFTEQKLDALFEPYRELLLKTTLIPGGREKLYVLRAG